VDVSPRRYVPNVPDTDSVSVNCAHPRVATATLLAHVQRARESCREYLRALGEPVWEPPERFADGTLRGWRTWATDSDFPLVPLRSFNGAPGNAWPRGVLEARCLLDCGDVVRASCTCGIYAFSRPDHEELVEALHHSTRARAVLGEVSGWGQANLHEDGWRAEYVMIRRLWTRGFTSYEASRLADFYDVAVHHLDSSSCHAEGVP